MADSTKKQYLKARNAIIFSNVWQTILLSVPGLWLFLSFYDDDYQSKQPLFGILTIISTAYLTYRWVRTIDGLKLLKQHFG